MSVTAASSRAVGLSDRHLSDKVDRQAIPTGVLLSRAAGHCASLLTAQASLSGSRPGPFEKAQTAMADDLGVTRSHLHSLFAGAGPAGYVRLPAGRRRPVELLPSLWDAFDRFLTSLRAGQDAITWAALADARCPAADRHLCHAMHPRHICERRRAQRFRLLQGGAATTRYTTPPSHSGSPSRPGSTP